MDDLHKLVYEQLPRLAYAIMAPLSRAPNSLYGGRHNFVRSANWDPLHEAQQLHYAGPIDGGYHYKGRWSKAEGGHLMDQWWIGFHGFRSTGPGNIPKGEPEVLDPGAVQLVEVDRTANNGPGFITYEIARREEGSREHERTLGALAELEYKRSMRALVKGGIPGIGEAEVETTQELRARVEATASDRWRASDTLEESVDKTYEVYPYHQLTVSVKRGKPRMRQTIPVSHGLECRVRIYVYNAAQDEFDTIADIARTWQGLRSGSRYSGWFAESPISTDHWTWPHAAIDLEVEGERVRYSDTVYDHIPIPGKEAEAARYVAARLKSI